MIITNSFTRLIVTITVMLVAVVEVLDMTIVNVSLPPMMGSLGANSDQITWVLTSYIVSAAIFMPLTGFLVKRFGRKRLLMVNIVGFLLASVCCGMATSLMQMVAFRTLQGIFGAALVPLSQYILRDSYPKAEHGKAMAIWGIGIMAGPVLGPTLGGIITDAMSWRWVFYINVPVCCLSAVLAWHWIAETETVNEPVDWWGMLLMILSIGCLQIFLDRGNSNDWLQAHSMQILCAVWIISFIAFVAHCLQHENAIIHLRLFRDKQFAICQSLILLFSAAMLGLVAMQPMMMETVMGYTTKASGYMMAPRGIASAIAMIAVSRLISKYDARWFLVLGLLLCALGVHMMTGFAVNSSQSQIMLAGAVQGFGMGLFFVPLSTVAFSQLPQEDIAEASGLFSFGRSLGSSIGISILSTATTRAEQHQWHQLVTHLTPYQTNVQAQSIYQLNNLVAQQAGMNSYLLVFGGISVLFLLMIPALFTLSPNHAK